MTTAADMERVGGRCETCDRPLATKQDAKDIPPGEGEHLCWGACEPEDWRARALTAEQQMRELAEVAARNVNDASHLRRTATDLEKILLREGGVEGACERRLAEALRERDEARDEVERLRAEAARLRLDLGVCEHAHTEEACGKCTACLSVERDSLFRQLNEARAEVERLSKLENSLPASLRDAHVVVEELRAQLRTTAEAQREACARWALNGVWKELELNGFVPDEMELANRMARLCHATPLVTEEKP